MIHQTPLEHIFAYRLNHKKALIAHRIIEKGRNSISEIMDPNKGYKTPQELIGILQDMLNRYASGVRLHYVVKTNGRTSNKQNNLYELSKRTSTEINEKLIGTYPMMDKENIVFPLGDDTYIIIENLGAKRKEVFHALKKYLTSELKKNLELIKKLNQDPLTGAYNRQFFERFGLEHTPENMEKTGKKFLIFGIDLDAFKDINDKLGHDMGDQALIVTTQILSQAFGRGIDYVCRVGGDEFCVIIDATDWDDSIIDKNRELLEAKIQYGLRVIGDSWIPEDKMIANPPKLGLTVGVGYMNSEHSLEAAKINAEIAMMQKKPEIGRILRLAGGMKDIQDTSLLPIVLDAITEIESLQGWPHEEKELLKEIIQKLNELMWRNSKK